MPGPRNAKKKKRIQAKKEKGTKSTPQSIDQTSLPSSSELLLPLTSKPLPSIPSSAPTPIEPITPPIVQYLHDQFHPNNLVQDYRAGHGGGEGDVGEKEFLPKKPFIHDPGNGPRVRDARAFLASSFASPPSLDDPLCAEFAQDEVLQMLCSVLPDEIAMILWYNKSRVKSRICPACQRLYRLGDVLQDHLEIDEQDVEEHEGRSEDERVSPNRLREQQISGLCSPMCFILAAFNYPTAIRSTWGRMAEELSDETWDALDTSSEKAQNDMGLGMLLKMTRCHDLGLGQLFFPDLDLDEEVLTEEEESEQENYDTLGENQALHGCEAPPDSTAHSSTI